MEETARGEHLRVLCKTHERMQEYTHTLLHAPTHTSLIKQKHWSTNQNAAQTPVHTCAHQAQARQVDTGCSQPPSASNHCTPSSLSLPPCSDCLREPKLPQLGALLLSTLQLLLPRTRARPCTPSCKPEVLLPGPAPPWPAPAAKQLAGQSSGSRPSCSRAGRLVHAAPCCLLLSGSIASRSGSRRSMAALTRVMLRGMASRLQLITLVGIQPCNQHHNNTQAVLVEWVSELSFSFPCTECSTTCSKAA